MERQHTTPVEVAERFADGFASDEERASAAQTDDAVFTTYHTTLDEIGYYAAAGTYDAAHAAACEPVFEATRATAEYAAEAAYFASGCCTTDAAMKAWYAKEHSAQTALLRDIFGNPFCPTTFSAAWRTDTAVSLARQMYESRDFSAMPILADALQDAGCDNDDILNHCRSPGAHVRGCWVVDLVLGKE